MMRPNYVNEILDGIAVTRFLKKPTLSEILNAMDEIIAMGDCRRRLWILQNGMDLRSEDVVEIARHGKAVWPVPSRAAIVAFDDLSFGIARVHDAYRRQDRHETRVFRSEEEAVAWLKE